MSKPFSMRLTESTRERLKLRAERNGTAPRTLAQRYLEEGLRMDEHPLVIFADGPAGRRARLAGTGADIWEVIATIKDNDGSEEAAADYLSMPPALVNGAVSYYGSYPEEIDSLIERNSAETDEAEARWLAGRAALSR
ncbi:MAG: hypothetical protein F2811_06495 [Actinobacteria bacterium]|nr:hypothetical protein [Actinomycetota bacterium]